MAPGLSRLHSSHSSLEVRLGEHQKIAVKLTGGDPEPLGQLRLGDATMVNTQLV